MPIKLNSSGGGSVTLDVPSTASDFTATMPANTGTVITTGSTAAVTQGMLASGLAGNGPAFSAYLSTNQNISSSVFTKMQINTEYFDTNNNYDNSTNYRFTPTVAGYYAISGSAVLAGTTLTQSLITVYKNGSEYTRGNQLVFSSGNLSISGSSVTALAYLNGSTDYVELYGYIIATSPYFYGDLCYFSSYLVRAA